MKVFKLTRIALVGQPNVGKSCVFNFLTGLKAIASNYPGTTVEIKTAKAHFRKKQVEIIDLPGIHALSDTTEDERVTKDYLIQERPDAIIQIIDSTAFARNLYLTLQLLELKIPLVLALNFHEEAKEKGTRLNIKKIKEELGVEAVYINALSGKGIDHCTQKAIKAKNHQKKIRYCKEIEKAIRDIEKLITTKELEVPKRYVAIKILEKDHSYQKHISSKTKLKRIIDRFKGKDIKEEITIKRQGMASVLAEKCSTTKEEPFELTISEKIDEIISHRPIIGGVLILLLMLSFFFLLVYVGGALEELITALFEKLLIPLIMPQIGFLGSTTTVIIKYLLIGLEAGLAIAIPYIMLFYIFLAILEDSGLLSRIVFLFDRAMHTMGLHGKALVPMMLGFGCNVPALIATRILGTKRERIISCTLITMVPCSARTAIILGAAGFYLGWQYALLIYAIILILILIVGKVLAKYLPGEMTGMIMEMPEYRRPSFKNIFAKTWLRMKDFVNIAFPLLIAGSGVIGLLQALNLLETITKPFDPVLGKWLMLPTVAGIALIFGILRKEMALETLAVLAGTTNLLAFMSPMQIFTFSLVSAIYMPCLATFIVLTKELDWKKAILISTMTIILAVLIAGALLRTLPLMGILT